MLDQLRPDLILTQGRCDVCAVTPETIEASLRGVQCELAVGTKIISFDGESLEGICEDLVELAEAVGLPTRAEGVLIRRQE